MCAATTLASAVRTHAVDDCDSAVATSIGVVRNERGRCHSLSREDQCILLVEPAGSASATYVVSVINDANCPHHSINRRVVVGRHRRNRRCQIP